VAQFVDGFMASMGTAGHWLQGQIKLRIQKCNDELEPVGDPEDVDVINLSGAHHIDEVRGQLVALNKRLTLDNWENALPNIQRHPKFIEWIDGRDAVCKKKILDKSSYIHKLDFQCGEPHIKSLAGYEFSAKELRITVHGNSELRIIFSPLGETSGTTK
jgi:hypothetical protein